MLLDEIYHLRDHALKSSSLLHTDELVLVHDTAPFSTSIGLFAIGLADSGILIGLGELFKANAVMIAQAAPFAQGNAAPVYVPDLTAGVPHGSGSI
jgi:hypothetical protein